MNTLKVRDDAELVKFSRAKCQESGDETMFATQEGARGSALGASFGRAELRRHIEPWLTSLFQSEHLSLLAGSGLTHAVHILAMGKPGTGMEMLEITGKYSKYILAAAQQSAKESGRGKPNLEDQLRTVNELIRGLQILERKHEAEQLESNLKQEIAKFADSVLKTERNIASGEKGSEKAWNHLVTFLMSFASRTGVRDRLNIFTTNYDRLIEAGAEFAGLHLIDRFVGNLTPIFRSSRLDIDLHYNPPGIRGEPRYVEGVARYTKLHGSLDWVDTGEDIRRIGLPFGAPAIEPYLQAPGLEDASAYQLMIYPNAAKDRETAEYPYVDLFRDFAAAVCRPNSTVVLYGYGFGDDHINRVLRDMLTIPSTHLVMIALNDEGDRFQKFYDEVGRPSQISVLIGPELGNLENLTTYYLPKPAIDKATYRMGELLRRRYGGGDKSKQTDPPPSSSAQSSEGEA